MGRGGGGGEKGSGGRGSVQGGRGVELDGMWIGRAVRQGMGKSRTGRGGMEGGDGMVLCEPIAIT